MSKKVLIIGGVAAGATAIARMRRLDEEANLILFEKGGHVSFANCGLPYYIGGVIEERDALLVSTKEKIEERYNAEVRLMNEVLSIDKENKKVRVKNHTDGTEYEETYDALVIATGSNPIVPPLEGIDSENVFTLWNMADTDRVYNFIAENKPKRAVVVGGGFIGIEVAENLRDKGFEVSIVEMANQIMAPFDKDMAMILENHMKHNGVNLYLGEGLEAIKDGGKVVKLNTGRELEADLIMLSIGVRPNTKLAKEAGLKLNERGAIIVDERMQTSEKDIYAAGDIVEVIDFNTKGKTVVPLAGPANKQGRLLGADILGGKEETYRGTQGTSIAKVFEYVGASTGLNEKTLNRMGKKYKEDYLITKIYSKSHAGYYPGAMMMCLKLIYDMDGKVLGAQIAGHEGVDKRIDVIATAINFGANVYDLQKLELAYAPPFSSAKDPVNMLGYVSANRLEGLTDPISMDEFKEFGDSVKLIDLREADEIAVFKIPNSIEIRLGDLRKREPELDKNTTYVLICAGGLRGYIAERILKQKGYKVYNLMGGEQAYVDSIEADNIGMPSSLN